jgi:type II secretory pathway predicted ATPase ExeA/outer membrane protein OmpA-like peptidoglycan-associated protein
VYRQYYNLSLSPFKVEPDPEFLWLGEKHMEGLSALQYAIQENKGFLLLTGDVGTGKTVLIHHLRNNLPPHIKVAFIQDPGIETLDLYRILSSEFKIGRRFEGKANFLAQFKKFLYVTYALHEQLLVIIDEAHRLSHELLDEIRVLSNIDFENKKLINFFYVGQGEFKRILMDERNRAVRQRIAVSYHLSPLDGQETRAYIRHRLKIAGSEKELFSTEAACEIHRLSGGIPRLINIICDRALLTGCIRELKQIGPETVRECASELDVPLGVPVQAAEKVPQIAPTPEKTELAANLPKRNPQWLIPALGVTLGILLYLALSSGPRENVQSPEPAVTIEQGSGGRKEMTTPPPGKQTSERSEDIFARHNTPPSGNNSAKASVEVFQAAGSLKDTIDRPVAVIRKRDPWEKMPVKKAESATPEENKVMSGVPEISKATGPEIVSTTQGLTTNVQRFYIFFKPGSVELKNTSFDVLVQVSQRLSLRSDSRATLTSFYDAKDKKGSNRKLSALRANSVKSFFASRGFGARVTVSENPPEGLPENADDGSWSEIRLETGDGR